MIDTEDVKKRWIEALRSGNYKQGTGYLCHDDKFCCLGVLCELVKKDLNLTLVRHSVKGASPRMEGVEEYFMEYSREAGLLPFAVTEALGIADSSFEIGNTFLTELNDSGATFKEIAEIIEEQWNV